MKKHRICENFFRKLKVYGESKSVQQSSAGKKKIVSAVLFTS